MAHVTRSTLYGMVRYRFTHYTFYVPTYSNNMKKPLYIKVSWLCSNLVYNYPIKSIGLMYALIFSLSVRLGTVRSYKNDLSRKKIEVGSKIQVFADCPSCKLKTRKGP